MKKCELDFLERVFAREIEGHLYQTKSKLAKTMEDRGFIVKETKTFGKDRFGAITAEGYRLTIQGNMAYCTSDRCK